MANAQHLHWQNWYRSSGCRYHMDRNSYKNVSYSKIFWDAMRILFYDENGNAGLLYKGGLYQPAKDVVAFNNGRMNGFDNEDLQRMLRDGLFWRYSEITIPDPFHHGIRRIDTYLSIEGPDLPEDSDIYAKANCPGILIEFNFYFHIALATQLSLSVDQLTWLTAATMLHEIMHNHGFSHPRIVDYTAESDYASTLPFVAEQAVCRASPHWKKFKKFYDNNMWLSSPARRVCGTHD